MNGGDGEIIRLLSEIRDNQLKQLESQRASLDSYRAALRRQRRTGLIAAIVVGGFFGWFAYRLHVAEREARDRFEEFQSPSNPV